MVFGPVAFRNFCKIIPVLFTWDYLTRLRVHKRDQHSHQAGDNEPKEALDIRTLYIPQSFDPREAYRHCGSRVSSVEVDLVIHRHPFTFACITVPAEQAVQHRSAVFRHTRVQRGACRVL